MTQYRVLLIVRNRNDQEVTINYGTYSNKFNAAHAMMTAMSDDERDWYSIEEIRVEVLEGPK